MIIYKLTNNVNNKIYIGQTVNYNERMRHHKESAFRVNSKEYSRPLYRAIRKYGWDNFTIDIIDNATTLEELNEKEIYWIKKYDSCIDNGKGYNLDKGGKNGLKSELTKQKMSKSQSGKLNPSYGKRGGDCHNAKKVINLTTGKIYNSMIECAIEEYGDKKYLKQISKVCDPESNRLTYKGNIYRKYNEDGTIIDKRITVTNKSFSKLQVIDMLSGRIFESISDTAKFFGISHSMVRDRIYNRVKRDKYSNDFKLQIYNND